MKSLLADLAEKEAAKTYPMQAGLGLFSPAFIQFNTISVAIIALSELPKGLPTAAAGVEQVGSHSFRELNPP